MVWLRDRSVTYSIVATTFNKKPVMTTNRTKSENGVMSVSARAVVACQQQL
jgi:hypothetical protein